MAVRFILDDGTELSRVEYDAFVVAEKAAAKELRNSNKLADSRKRVEKLSGRVSDATAELSKLQVRLDAAKADLTAREVANSVPETVSETVSA